MKKFSILEKNYSHDMTTKENCLLDIPIGLDEKPLVSVIMPTYRNEKFLDRAIKSVANQTYKNIELIIIDDNANSEWNKIVITIIENYHDILNILYLQNKNNLGSAKSRNKGIDNANGTYITFLDDDDEYLSKKIDNQVSFMLSNNADMTITDLYLYNDNGSLVRKREHNYMLDSNNFLALHLKYHLTGTDSLMFLKSYLLEIGKFDEIDLGDEFYLVLKAIFNKGKILYLPECQIKAYVHANGIGLTAGRQKEIGEINLFEKKKTFFPILNKKDIKYIKMRHYLVFISCDLKNKNYLNLCKDLFNAFISYPIEFISFCFHRKEY